MKKILIKLTKECNLNCTYCTYYNNNLPNIKYEFDYLESIIKEIQNFEKIEIEFFGGEPLLKFDYIVDIVLKLEQLFPQKIKWSLPTNFLLMNQKIYNFLKEYNFQVSLSFDGLWQDIQRPSLGNKSNLEIYLKKQKQIILYKNIIKRIHCMIYPTGLKQNTIVQNYQFIKDNFSFEPDFEIIIDNNVWDQDSFYLLYLNIKEFYEFYEKNTNRFNEVPSLFKKWINKIYCSQFKNMEFTDCGIQDQLFINLSDQNITISNCERVIEYNKEESELLKNNEFCKSCEINNICERGCLSEFIKYMELYNSVDIIKCKIYKTLYYFAQKIIYLKNEENIKLQQKILQQEGILDV